MVACWFSTNFIVWIVVDFPRIKFFKSSASEKVTVRNTCEPHQLVFLDDVIHVRVFNTQGDDCFRNVSDARGNVVLRIRLQSPDQIGVQSRCDSRRFGSKFVIMEFHRYKQRRRCDGGRHVIQHGIPHQTQFDKELCHHVNLRCHLNVKNMQMKHNSHKRTHGKRYPEGR